MYKQGMLWLDKDKGAIPDRVAAAVAHFRQKYGTEPLYVLANDRELDEETTVDGLAIKPYRGVLQSHLVVVQS